MSSELIESLREKGAFEATPRPADLGALHVPFDQLLGAEVTESPLQEAVQGGGRLAIVGAMGAGKSSVLSYSLTPFDGFAAIPVSVAPESDETVTDPGRFAQHVVRVVSTWAAEADMLTGAQRDQLLADVAEHGAVAARGRITRGGLTIQLPWILKGELARDVSRELQPALQTGRSAGEYLTALRRLMQMIRTVDLQPVLVIDDSDRWLRRSEPRPEIVGPFFGSIIRELADLEASLAIAVHENYLALDEYKEGAMGVLNTRIDVPLLTDPDQLAAILDHRISLFMEHGDHHEVFDDDGLSRLWQYYCEESEHSLRKTIQIAHTAVGEADRAELNEVGEAMVDSAIVAW